MDTHIEEKKDRGFTLVELLIVIVILGILATVTVFAVRGITNKGKESACAADKKTIEVAAESYMANNGVYPDSLQQMVDAGLLRDVASSANWAYSHTAGDPNATPPVVEDFSLAPAQGSDCTIEPR